MNKLLKRISRISESISYVSIYQDDKYICEKAEMKNTKVHLSAREAKRLANGYGETNKLVPHFANTLWGAGGGLKSTISDLVNYMKFQLGNNKVVMKSHELLYSDEHI